MAKLKLTDERINTVLGLIARGSTDKAACEAAGIDASTFYRWARKGEIARSGQYCQFFHDLKKARAYAYQKHLSLIGRAASEKQELKTRKVTTHADGTQTIVEETREQAPAWQASAWLLERRYPQEFSKNRHLSDSEENKILPWCDDGPDLPDPLGEY